jgi:hypothetical protein
VERRAVRISKSDRNGAKTKSTEEEGEAEAKIPSPESETKPRWSCSGKKKKNWTNPLVVSRRLVAEPPQQEDERACSVAGSLLRLASRAFRRK